MKTLLDNWEEEPTLIRRRDLRTDKYIKEKAIHTPRINKKRRKPIGTYHQENQDLGDQSAE